MKIKDLLPGMLLNDEVVAGSVTLVIGLTVIDSSNLELHTVRNSELINYQFDKNALVKNEYYELLQAL